MSSLRQVETRSRMNTVVANAMARESTRLPVIAVAAVMAIGEATAVDFVMKTDGDAYALAQRFTELSDSRLKLVEGSVYPIRDDGKSFRAILLSTAKSLPYTEENLKGKLVIRANVFEDETDHSIWKTVGDGDARRIVQTPNEDQASILQKVYDPNVKYALASTASNVSDFALPGDMVAYYNEKRQTVCCGIVADIAEGKDETDDTVKVLDKDSREPVDVKSPAILAHVAVNKAYDKWRELRAANGGDAGQQYLSYLRSLYEGNAAAKEMLSALEAQIRGAGKK